MAHCYDIFPSQLGLVCFRLVGPDSLSEELLNRLNDSGLIHMVPATVRDTYVIRFCVCAKNAKDGDIGKRKRFNII